jgi:hypothetical protein
MQNIPNLQLNPNKQNYKKEGKKRKREKYSPKQEQKHQIGLRMR